jgi:hypothetical protein
MVGEEGSSLTVGNVSHKDNARRWPGRHLGRAFPWQLWSKAVKLAGLSGEGALSMAWKTRHHERSLMWKDTVDAHKLDFFCVGKYSFAVYDLKFCASNERPTMNVQEKEGDFVILQYR